LKKSLEIQYIDELHFSHPCTDEKIDVTPHIDCRYSPVGCDMWYFFCVVWKISHSSSWRLRAWTILWIAFFDWKKLWKLSM